MPASLYIGLMSGTSLDGVDGVLADFSQPPLRVLGHVHLDFEADFRAELLALQSPGADELQRGALAANRLAAVYAQAVQALLVRCGVAAPQVAAVGAHGQTVRHRPELGLTVQLNNPALLAELTGIDVVADFRSRDMAAGGQGAPLVPVFHRAVFARPGTEVAVLNLGGIGNLTLLHGDAGLLGFDCGPGNALMDHWVQRHRSQPYDVDGAWAASGRVLPALLERLLAEPYFALPPPKSTGRDLFNPYWLQHHLQAFGPLAPQDVQATLSELTARGAIEALQRLGPGTQELIVCGGGALNADLMARLQRLAGKLPVVSSAARGLPPLQVEAAAFAWLAKARLDGRPGNAPSVTGARRPAVLGALHSAR